MYCVIHFWYSWIMMYLFRQLITFAIQRKVSQGNQLSEFISSETFCWICLHAKCISVVQLFSSILYYKFYKIIQYESFSWNWQFFWSQKRGMLGLLETLLPSQQKQSFYYFLKYFYHTNVKKCNFKVKAYLKLDL